MNNKENTIEQIFKNAFEEFTPNVSPKVWGEVSKQIANPVAPASSVPTSVVKTVGTKLSTTGMWIIGGIVTTVITAALLIYTNNKNPEKGIASPAISSTEVESTNNKTVASEPTSALSGESQSVDNAYHAAPKQAEEVTNTVIKPIYAEEKPSVTQGLEGLDEKRESLEEKQNIIPSTPVQNNTTQKDNQTQENSTNVKEPENNNSVTDKSSPPIILINTTAGFAPLQVACLLNKENLKGDWNFGDGNLQQEASNVTHKYLKAGTYILQCTTGETTLTKTIEVIGEMITAFSPNGDGINDFFYVEAETLNNFSLRIVDRIGRKVSELKAMNEKWDGNETNGKAAEAGTYFYELKAVTQSGSEINQRGTVNLFR